MPEKTDRPILALRKNIKCLDAKLSRHVRETKRRFEGVECRFKGADGRFMGIEGRLGKVEGRLESVEGRLKGVETRLGSLEDKVQSVETRLDGKIDRVAAEMLRRFDDTASKSDVAEIKAQISAMTRILESAMGRIVDHSRTFLVWDKILQEHRATFGNHELRLRALEARA